MKRSHVLVVEDALPPFPTPGTCASLEGDSSCSQTTHDCASAPGPRMRMLPPSEAEGWPIPARDIERELPSRVGFILLGESTRFQAEVSRWQTGLGTLEELARVGFLPMHPPVHRQYDLSLQRTGARIPLSALFAEIGIQDGDVLVLDRSRGWME